MRVAEHFRSVVEAAGRYLTDAGELLPTVLAQACVAVLPVAGAGLSLIAGVRSPDCLRVPLGSSDAVAAQVERLQTTLGEGPCLTAADQNQTLIADADQLAARWPMFHSELIRRTPIRSIMSVPVTWYEPVEAIAALDLYQTTPQLEAASALQTALHGDTGIAAVIAELLFADEVMIESRGVIAPIWMGGPAITQRRNVWMAVGLLVEHAGLTSEDALALLRGYAFAHGSTLDDTAERIMTRRLDPTSVLSTAP